MGRIIVAFSEYLNFILLKRLLAKKMILVIP